MLQSKHQNKQLPVELLSDIFKATDYSMMENLSVNCYNTKSVCLKSIKECQKLWGRRIIALLTSSSIVYFFIGKNFKEKWVKIVELEKVIKEMERSTQEIIEFVEDKMSRLREKMARLDENTKLLEEKTTKIMKRLKEKEEDEEDAPIAKRTRSHSPKK
uniref:Uncharacterized protein n=1 Tax=Meloidogyne enterolobii TaxID=390850 RepID=A0A6V7Y940_MELEN|nr:unnamed protein product [Meloidogyne enterolobii]